MNRVAVIIAAVALVLAGIAGAYALSLSNRVDDAESAARRLRERFITSDDAANTASATASDLQTQVSLLEERLGQIDAQLEKMRGCLPDLQLEIEVLDVRSAGGDVLPYQTVATQVRASCRELLHVLFIGAD